MQEKSYKLMIPGPVQPKDDVMKAMGGEVMPHYGSAWTRIYNETTELLKDVFNTKGDVFILVGSGSAGIDACLGSLVPTGGKIVIGVNGFFGERLVAIAHNYGMEVLPVEEKLGTPLDPNAIKAVLNAHSDLKAVAVVHLETSTSIVNPIEAIGQVTREHKVPFVVDAVSSLGGITFDMDRWGVDMCATASQKCLGSPPGLAPVAVGQYAWGAIERNAVHSHGWYLDLRVWRQYMNEWADWHPFPITMATNSVLALRTSLKGLIGEGVVNREIRYSHLALHLREGLRRIGMQPYTPDELMAPVLTAAYGPPGVPTGEIVDYMDKVHNIIISGGLGNYLKDKIFRVGHMAPSITEADIDEVLEALESFRPDWR
jgi:alanine-glyoxylate transaminase/serine-glyoxylate transaminase/serine-pyruvate transaminase